MPIKIGTITMDNCKVGNDQIGKICCGTTTIWENWKPYTKTISAAEWDDFVPEEYANYTVPSNVIITKISCTAWGYDHNAAGSERCITSAHIYINNVDKAEGRAGATGGAGETCYSSCSLSGNWGSGTRIKVGSTGLSFHRGVSATLTGLKKGS